MAPKGGVREPLAGQCTAFKVSGQRCRARAITVRGCPSGLCSAHIGHLAFVSGAACATSPVASREARASGDGRHAPATPEAAAKKASAENAAAEKAAAEKAATHKLDAAKTAAEHQHAQLDAAKRFKEAAQRAVAEKAQRKAVQEQTAVEKAATERVAARRAASEKAVVERKAAENAASEASAGNPDVVHRPPTALARTRVDRTGTANIGVDRCVDRCVERCWGQSSAYSTPGIPAKAAALSNLTTGERSAGHTRQVASSQPGTSATSRALPAGRSRQLATAQTITAISPTSQKKASKITRPTDAETIAVAAGRGRSSKRCLEKEVEEWYAKKQCFEETAPVGWPTFRGCPYASLRDPFFEEVGLAAGRMLKEKHRCREGCEQCKKGWQDFMPSFWHRGLHSEAPGRIEHTFENYGDAPQTKRGHDGQDENYQPTKMSRLFGGWSLGSLWGGSRKRKAE